MSGARRSGSRRRTGTIPALVAAIVCVAAGAAAPSASAATGEFQTRASSPAAVTSVAVDPATNVIYAQENGGTKFFSYDPGTDAWTELAPAPVNSENNGGATYLNGKIYTAYTENKTTLGVYDIETNSWSEIANPLGAGTGDIASVGGLIYMVAGTHFIAYDPEAKTTTTLASAPKLNGGRGCEGGFEAWGGLQPYEGKIYGHQGNGCAGFAVYDIASDSWSELPSLPAPIGSKGGAGEEEAGAVAGSALDPTSGTYYAYGNYGGETLYRYDIAAKSWSEVTFPFTNIDDGGMAYVSLPGKRGVYATYGETSTGFTRYLPTGPPADLTLTKSADKPNAQTGEEITYTIKVTNAGPNEAPGTVVTDPLPVNVSLVSAVSTQGACTGTAAVSCDVGALEDEGSATITIVVKADTAGTATNTASVSSEAFDPTPADESASATTSIKTPPGDLALTKSADVSSTTVAGNITYTITASDNGPNEAPNTVVSDPLPSNVGFVSASASQGSCAGSSTVTCTLGTLEKGASATITLVVRANAAGTATNTASVSSDALDLVPANDSASATTTILAPPPSNAATTGATVTIGTPPPAPALLRPTLLPARWLVPNGILRPSAGWVSGPLSNPNRTLTLSGTAQLVTYVASGKGEPQVLARSTVFLAAGATKALFLHLKPAARAKLARAHQFKVQLQLTLTDQFGRQVKASGIYALRGPKVRPHKQKRPKK
jgi:uncharacterized repeat protein (TIGR01451 family)